MADVLDEMDGNYENKNSLTLEYFVVSPLAWIAAHIHSGIFLMSELRDRVLMAGELNHRIKSSSY